MDAGAGRLMGRAADANLAAVPLRTPMQWGPALYVLAIGAEGMLRYAGWQWRLVLLLLLQSLPLLLRHRAPRWVFALLVVTSTLQALTGVVTNAILGAYIALAALVQRLQRPWSLAPAVALALTHGVAARSAGAVIVITLAGAALVAWFFGDLIARERTAEAVLAGRVERLARGERLRADAAVLGERLRIGRELHEVVGRALDAVVVHASVARALLREGREGVAVFLQQIEALGRDALDDLDRLLSLLRPIDLTAAGQPEESLSTAARRPRPPWQGPLKSALALVAPTAVLGLVGGLGAVAAASARPELGVWPFALAALVAAPLLLRWRHPVAVLAWTCGLLAISQASVDLDLNNLILAVPIALHAVALTRPRRESRAALLAVLAVQLPVGMLTLEALRWEFAMVVAGFCFVAWRMGCASRTAAELAGALRERAEQLAAERELRLERALAAERMQIVREAHDSVGHTLSMIVLVAGAARAALDSQSARAAKALTTIEDSARSTLSDMDRIAGTLRTSAMPGDLSPRLVDLPRLAGRLKDAGVEIEVALDGDAEVLPESLQACAYRIVQEALTNVVKHSGARHCRIRVDVGADALALEIVDDGSGSGPTVHSGGRGTIGMRERAELFGGTFAHGPEPNGGYAVRAVLPRSREEVPA